MRKLNIKQKKILLEWVKNIENIGLSFRAEDLPGDLYFKLQDLNDFEIFNQKIEHFVIDNLDIERRFKE